MPFDFEFRSLEDERDVRELEAFLISHPLDYPHFQDWVRNRVIPEIYSGNKQVILMLSEGILVGDAIFQPHKTRQRELEFKSMRMHPKVQGRYFGVFTFRNVEVEARKSGKYDAIICDTRSDRPDVIGLLKFCNYREIARAQLYDSNNEDIIFRKELDSPNRLGTSIH
jgi:hypothetical protein